MTPFGRFHLIKKLATGGMAEVFLARQPMGTDGDGRHVVVKRILPHLSDDPDYLKMFQNEARLATQFSHPNIAHIFEYGQEAGKWFIAMEFIHGEDLGRLMRQAWATEQWIAAPLALRIVAIACEGLHYAHQRNVVHRDISPQNILVSFDGSVKVVDFGIARGGDASSLSSSGGIKGKFAYLAPEQANAQPLDARTDVFALGLVLYEMLTGVRPLKRDSDMATLMAAMECAIDAPSVAIEMTDELDEVVMRALAKSPADRYPDARAFQAAIEAYLAQKQLIASSVQLSELMRTLFADRLAEESAAGAPRPVEVDAPPPTQRERPATSTAPRTPKQRPLRTSSGSMPEAPPRNTTSRKPKGRAWAAPPPPEPTAPVDVPPRKTGGAGWLFAIVLVAALGGASWWWWWSQQVTLTGHPVKVSIDTQPPTTVRVVPAQPGQPERSLGTTPVVGADAMLEDLIVLESDEACIHFDLRFPFNDPSPDKRISKSFEKGKVKLVAGSANSKGLTLLCHGRAIGPVPGTVALYEGTPPVVVSGEGLAAPVPLSITVLPGKTQIATVELGR